jgi:hypothetical protein
LPSSRINQGTHIGRIPVVLLDLDPAKLGKGGGNPAEQQEEGEFVSQSGGFSFSFLVSWNLVLLI